MSCAFTCGAGHEPPSSITPPCFVAQCTSTQFEVHNLTPPLPTIPLVYSENVFVCDSRDSQPNGCGELVTSYYAPSHGDQDYYEHWDTGSFEEVPQILPLRTLPTKSDLDADFPWSFLPTSDKTISYMNKSGVRTITYPFSMKSPEGRKLTVTSECGFGSCSCVHILGGVRNQLKPCRFASIVMSFDDSLRQMYLLVLWHVIDGVPIVEGDVDPYCCENYSSITCPDIKPKMDEIIRRELADNMVSVSREKPRCVHALGAVPKGNGGIRQITDCSRPKGSSINFHVDSLLEEFCFKSVDDVVSDLSCNDCMAVVDIKSAYRAIPIKPSHRKFQGFSWNLSGEDEWYIDNRLCFGHKLGPMYFNRFSAFMYDTLTLQGHNVVNYLDDFITVSGSEESCMKSQRAIVDLIRYLGFYIAFDKLVHPSQCVVFLGIEIDSTRMELRLPKGKVEKLRNLLELNISKKRISKKELESLGGLLSHCSHIIRGSRVFCKRVYALYKDIIKSNARFIHIPEIVKADLQWWLKFSKYFNGTAKIVVESYKFPMVSDSSLKGFAAYLGRDWLAGVWHDNDCINLCSSCAHVMGRPFAEYFDASNINVLELWPILQGVRRWFNVLKNKSLYVFTDNTQVMYMLINGGSSNVTCSHWVRELFWLTAIYNIVLIPKYVNTKSNLVADTLSRLPYKETSRNLFDYLNGSDLCCLPLLFANYRNGER